MRLIVVVLLVAALGVAVVVGIRSSSKRKPAAGPPPNPEAVEAITKSVPHRVGANLVNEVLEIEARERAVAETVWAKEILAQECGRTIEKLWDEINRASNKLEVLREFDCGEVVIGSWEPAQNLPHGIQVQRSIGKESKSREGWRELIDSLLEAGWTLDLIEFRHVLFETDVEGNPEKSRFYLAAHARNAGAEERASLRGEIEVRWAGKPAAGELVAVEGVDGTGLELALRSGAPLFKTALAEEIEPMDQSGRIDPLILYDLDGDGLSEIILAARNLVYWNKGGLQFARKPLCAFPEEFIATAVIADFDADGHADFLCHKWEGMFLFKGSPEGKFSEKPRRVWQPKEPLIQPMVLTCGDVDADGDLDLFLGQYKEPYEGGATPKPFYDANDGWPAYLLLNDGSGTFSDGTRAAGLTQKRFRRSYSSSFADLDGDSDLDLVVVSDFAGVDLYRNDGKGRFQDVTKAWAAAPYAFGMAHALNDFNNDGRIDLLMMGMTSPTVRRLDHLGLRRGTEGKEKSMRTAMTHGNRLYLGQPAGGFAETALSETIASSGWSWGCSALDFDNDGWVDVYIANGLESNSSVVEYEPEYWLHDRYVGLERATAGTDLYFKSKFSRTRSRSHSYGGHEINRFFLNLGGTNFFEAGYLLGVALQEDCRGVASDDLNGDGKLDLLVTTLEIWPEKLQRLLVLANEVENDHEWIGIRFSESPGAPSPAGVQIELEFEGKKGVRQVVTGDSYRSQHASSVHFGLGSQAKPERLSIQLPTGSLVITNGLGTKKHHRIDLAPLR